MDSFLPAMRILISKKLHDDGLSQSKISSLLGVTQASVSLYLSSDYSKAYQMLKRLAIEKEQADRYAALIAEDLKRNPVYATSTLYSIWSDILGKGMLCIPHRALYPFLAECDICIRVFSSKNRREGGAIEHVSRAVELIEATPSFVDIMPEVSVNIAYAEEGAKGIEDVVAIPGRIIKVRNRARAMLRPEYGASTHLAKILLLVKGKIKGVSSVINLKYDGKIARILREMKITCIRIGGKYPEGAMDPVVEALRERLAEVKKQFNGVIDIGGKGLEPNVYLFAEDAISVAKLAIRIAERYSSS